MKPEFYVIRLGRATSGAVAPPPVPVAQRAARADAQLRARGFEEVLPPEAAPDLAGPNEVGYEVSRAELRDPVVKFYTVESAEKYAQELAEKSPKVLFAVMGVLKVFETTVPTVLEKRFNDKGELVLSEDN